MRPSPWIVSEAYILLKIDKKEKVIARIRITAMISIFLAFLVSQNILNIMKTTTKNPAMNYSLVLLLADGSFSLHS